MAVQDHKTIAHSAGWFTQFATWSASFVGSPGMFIFAIATILAWLITGPVYHFSDTWQLVINS